MKNTIRFSKLLTLTLAALALTAMASADDGGRKGSTTNTSEVRLRARLSGPAIQNITPDGSADFRMDDQGRTRLDVEVERVNLPAATVLTVALVHGGVSTNIGMITLSSTGFGELELRSDNGNMVPTVQAGDMITVSNGATAFLSGIFAAM
jgi:hypothetical protein